ncbi:MAG: hypothetical protein NTZ05_15090 [Chloroflexi bacterium]|nr:hypothetical protein [Chloroflexota bacterium]
MPSHFALARRPRHAKENSPAADQDGQGRQPPGYPRQRVIKHAQAFTGDCREHDNGHEAQHTPANDFAEAALLCGRFRAVTRVAHAEASAADRCGNLGLRNDLGIKTHGGALSSNECPNVPNTGQGEQRVLYLFRLLGAAHALDWHVDGEQPNGERTSYRGTYRPRPGGCHWQHHESTLHRARSMLLALVVVVVVVIMLLHL